MLGGGFFVKFVDSKNGEPFGVGGEAKALPEREAARTAGFY